MDNNENNLNLICKKCGNKSLYRCSNCKNTFYCSQKCQIDDWERHKIECLNNINNNNNQNKENLKNENTIKINKTLSNKLNVNNNNQNKENNKFNVNNSKIFLNGNDTSFQVKNSKVNVLPKIKVNSFNFLQKISQIIKQGNIDHCYILYNLIGKHRKFIIENNLFSQNDNLDDKPLLYFYQIYKSIENYIYNYIIYIKYNLVTKNNNRKIKGNNALIQISKEIFEGILSYTINNLITRCCNSLINKISNFQVISYSRLILSSYIKIISLLFKYSDYLENEKLFFKYLNLYGNLYDTILLSSNKKKSREKNILRSNLYFNIANIYIKKNFFSIGISLLKKTISIQINSEQYSLIAISSIYNISILYYIMNNVKESESYIIQALEKLKILKGTVSLPIYKEIINEILIKILIFYAEINIDMEKYELALENLKEALNILIKENKQSNTQNSENENSYYLSMNESSFKEDNSKEENILMNFETIELERSSPIFKLKKIKDDSKYKSIINGLFDKIMYLKKDNDSYINLKYNSEHIIHSKSIKNKNENKTLFNFKDKNNPLYLNEENSNKILSYLNDKMLNKKKYLDIENSDFKNFFSLLTKLSPHQIEVLNKTQNSKMPIFLFKNLPIFFSKQFKNSLNPNQRILLDNLNILSLIRCKILKDVNKDISLNNLNYNLFQKDLLLDEYHIRKYSQLKNLISKVINENKSRRFSIKLPSQVKNQIQNLSLSSYEEPENSFSSEEDQIIIFKYDEEFNLDNFKNKVIQFIQQNYMFYSQEEIEILIKIINSNIFLITLNQLSLNEIKELNKEPEIIANLFYEQLKKGYFNLDNIENEKNSENKTDENNKEEENEEIQSKINNEENLTSEKNNLIENLNENKNNNKEEGTLLSLKDINTVPIKIENSIHNNFNENFMSNNNNNESIIFDENNKSNFNEFIKTTSDNLSSNSNSDDD